MKKTQIDKIKKIIQQYSMGHMIIMTDDESRENEGDLVVSSQCITRDDVNFMTKYGRGLICISIEQDIANKLDLPLMTSGNDSQFSTPFTVSVDAKYDTTTGISASDRLKTIKTIIDENSTAEDLLRPGHMFPLIAAQGGLTERNGHTEASVQMSSLAGHKPSGVICEIMAEDGSMSRGEELREFAKMYNLPMLAISELQEYISLKNNIGTFIPTESGDYLLYHYPSHISGQMPHIALVHKEINCEKSVTVRIHSECMTGDLFGSLRCDCGDQLKKSMELINDSKGMLIYLRHEGRGIGLPEKMNAYRLQDHGLDTVEANLKLGFESDERDYSIASKILKNFNISRIKLLTNNPDKMEALVGDGIQVEERLPIEIKPGKYSFDYMKTKKEKMNHLLTMEEYR